MFSSQEFWLAIIVALAAGIAAGFFLSRHLRHGGDSRADLAQQLRDLEEQQKQYRYNVTEHFSRTAELLGQLAGNYRDVHNHLARGAQELCESNTVRMLKTLPEDSPVLEEQSPTLVEQPRDYALRSGSYDASTLDEDFGLDKRARPAAVEPPRY